MADQCHTDPVQGTSGTIWTAWTGAPDANLDAAFLVSGSLKRASIAALVEGVATAVNAASLSTWSAVTTYPIGAVVVYGGTIYVGIAAANLNHQPNISPAWWTSVFTPGMAWSFDNKAASFNAAAWTHYTVDTTGANVTATLPAAAASAKAEIFLIKTAAANSMIVACADLVNGATSQTVTGQWDSVSLRCNGSTWHVIG